MEEPFESEWRDRYDRFGWGLLAGAVGTALLALVLMLVAPGVLTKAHRLVREVKRSITERVITEGDTTKMRQRTTTVSSSRTVAKGDTVVRESANTTLKARTVVKESARVTVPGVALPRVTPSSVTPPRVAPSKVTTDTIRVATTTTRTRKTTRTTTVAPRPRPPRIPRVAVKPPPRESACNCRIQQEPAKKKTERSKVPVEVRRDSAILILPPDWFRPTNRTPQASPDKQ